jgi:hypothetical protein
MTLEQAERLQDNEDFKAFIDLLDEDAKSILEDLVNHVDPSEIMRTQCKIQVLRGVKGRLGHVIEQLKPEAPVSDQSTDSAD